VAVSFEQDGLRLVHDCLIDLDEPVFFRTQLVVGSIDYSTLQLIDLLYGRVKALLGVDKDLLLER
jgi:hypothetical protein